MQRSAHRIVYPTFFPIPISAKHEKVIFTLIVTSVIQLFKIRKSMDLWPIVNVAFGYFEDLVGGAQSVDKRLYFTQDISLLIWLY